MNNIGTTMLHQPQLLYASRRTTRCSGRTLVIRLQRIYSFDCSMLLYYPFWIFMGFTLHIYIIFGTNILTEAQLVLLFFCLF